MRFPHLAAASKKQGKRGDGSGVKYDKAVITQNQSKYPYNAKSNLSVHTNTSKWSPEGLYWASTGLRGGLSWVEVGTRMGNPTARNARN